MEKSKIIIKKKNVTIYSFVLDDDDDKNLRSKFSTSSLDNNYGGRRYNIRVSIEQGIYMLTIILKFEI